MNIGKLFTPNRWRQNVDLGNGTQHKHAWGNRKLEVDRARRMLRASDKCAYGCGAKRTMDVRDLDPRAPRCS